MKKRFWERKSAQTLEQDIFNWVIGDVRKYIRPIQENARILSWLDCRWDWQFLQGNKICQPQMKDNDDYYARAGILRKVHAAGRGMSPTMAPDNRTQQIIVLTGPNMAGKSALLRQTGLIVLLAQIGSYVPAREATLGVVDKLFTRVGASDNIARRESTFMVEMLESAAILNNVTDRSLVLFDEIGRGTSTYDGISIAWAIVEYRMKSRGTGKRFCHPLPRIKPDG